MENCIFCKIATHELPKAPDQVKYEDERFIAFLDINPKSPGHTILIPKEHYRWFIDLPESLNDELFRISRKVAIALKKEYDADYIYLSIVGTDEPHVHVHLIPRKLSHPEAGV